MGANKSQPMGRPYGGGGGNIDVTQQTPSHSKQARFTALFLGSRVRVFLISPATRTLTSQHVENNLASPGGTGNAPLQIDNFCFLLQSLKWPQNALKKKMKKEEEEEEKKECRHSRDTC